MDTLFTDIIHDVSSKCDTETLLTPLYIQVVFLSLFNVPGIGTTWLDYVLPLACLLAVPFILPVHMDIYICIIYTTYLHYLQNTSTLYTQCI